MSVFWGIVPQLCLLLSSLLIDLILEIGYFLVSFYSILSLLGAQVKKLLILFLELIVLVHQGTLHCHKTTLEFIWKILKLICNLFLWHLIHLRSILIILLKILLLIRLLLSLVHWLNVDFKFRVGFLMRWWRRLARSVLLYFIFILLFEFFFLLSLFLLLFKSSPLNQVLINSDSRLVFLLLLLLFDFILPGYFFPIPLQFLFHSNFFINLTLLFSHLTLFSCIHLRIKIPQVLIFLS